MKDLNFSTGIKPLLSSITKSIFPSTRHPKARTISSGLFRLRGPSVRLVLAVLLASVTLSASLFDRGRSTSAFSESISTFQTDCTTPKSAWDLGETACAGATGAIADRRIIWVAPDGTIADVSTSYTGSASDTYTFLTTGPFAQYGTWTVKTVDNSGSGYAVASFLVRPAVGDNVDLVVSSFGPQQATAGGAVSYRVEILNRGPNAAQNVVLTETTPNNSTFASEAQNTSISGVICGDPNVGATGPSTCTIPTLAVNQSAVFTFVYNVNAGTPTGTLIVNTANVASSTNELFQNDNTATSQVEVVAGGASPSCTITCPANISVNNSVSDPNPCVKAVTYTTPTAGAGCADPDTGQIPTVVCSPPSGSNFPIGVSTVVCSAGATTCSFTITVNETRGTVTPTITCPANVSTFESYPGSGSARVNYPAPTTTGNCVSVVCNPPSGGVFELGTTPVTCNGTDSANTVVTCTFSVTVAVSTCGLDCPADMIVNESSPGSGSATVNYPTPTATGSCPTVTIVCNPASGSSFPVGTTQVNCTATDQSSNVLAVCGFGVTVNGSSTCTITCPANVTASESPSGSGSATVSYPPPTSSGTCGAAASCSPPSGSSFPIGTTTVHCTRSDPGGNVSSCSFTVTVTGGNTCTITCPANISDSSGGCGKAVNYPNPTTSGSCGDGTPPWSCNPPSGSFFPVGTTTVTCITDVGAQCSFTVTISGSDATAPTIIACASPRFVNTDSCQAEVPNLTSEVEATDNCTPVDQLVVTQSPAPGTFVGTGTNTITLTVRDANNNSSQCQTTFTVHESTPPTAVCKNITVFLSAGGTVSITGADVDNGSSDNCAIASRTVTPSTFTCANKGPNTVTLTVTDPSGNSANCQATVTVVDNLPPVITCPANITTGTDPNVCSAVVTYNATATDNCPGVGTPACSPASGSIFPKGTTTVTCTVGDASPDSPDASCTFTVTVNDTQLPNITCPANIVKEPTCPAGAKATFAPVVSDNCPGVTFVCNPASGSTFAIGTTTVTCTATDAAPANNTKQCSFTVTVKTAVATIQDLKTSVNSSSLNGSQKQGLISKLDAALDAIDKGHTNTACAKLADFINSVQNFIDHGDIPAAQGQAWINSAANVRNTLGCTNLPCS